MSETKEYTEIDMKNQVKQQLLVDIAVANICGKSTKEAVDSYIRFTETINPASLTPILRYNRSFIGLMEMCNTGYWTPADAAQKKINEQEEHLAAIKDSRDVLQKKTKELIKGSEDTNLKALKTLMRLNELKKEHRFIKGLLAFYLFKATVGIVIYICSFIAG